MFLVRQIPNALTSFNLVCGCLGIVALMQNVLVEPAYFIWAACVFDFLDGFAARALKVSSPIGKQLDSLADMVSFGVLPALSMFHWIDKTTENEYLPYIALVLAVFSALRLAKFNIDERQTDAFIGLPTPANALFITALPFLPEIFSTWMDNPYFLVGTALVFSYLLVAPFELFALKFKHFKWRGNQLRFTFVALAGLFLVLWGAAGLVPAILSYLLLSLTSRTWTITPK